MKDKLDDLLANKIPSDTAYRRIKDFPDQLDKEDAQLASFSRNQKATEKEMAVSIFIRYWVRHQVINDDEDANDSNGEEPRQQAHVAEEDVDEVMVDGDANNASEDDEISSERQSVLFDPVDARMSPADYGNE